MPVHGGHQGHGLIVFPVLYHRVIDAGAREPSVCILDKATKNDIMCQYIEDASTRSYIGEWATFSDVRKLRR